MDRSRLTAALLASGQIGPRRVAGPTISSVVWTNVLGATDAGGVLTATAATAWNNSGAWDAIGIGAGGGYFEFKTNETTTEKIIGLTSAPAGYNYTDPQFGIYLAGGNYGGIYESGSPKSGTIGAYATSDVFRMNVTAAGVVTYLRNGVVFYTSLATATLPLYAHAVFKTIGSTCSNAKLAK